MVLFLKVDQCAMASCAIVVLVGTRVGAVAAMDKHLLITSFIAMAEWAVQSVGVMYSIMVLPCEHLRVRESCQSIGIISSGWRGARSSRLGNCWHIGVLIT